MEVVLEFEENGVAAPLTLQVVGMARIQAVRGRQMCGDPEMAGWLCRLC